MYDPTFPSVSSDATRHENSSTDKKKYVRMTLGQHFVVLGAKLTYNSSLFVVFDLEALKLVSTIFHYF